METSVTRLTRRTLLHRSLAIGGGVAAASLVPTTPWGHIAAQGDAHGTEIAVRASICQIAGCEEFGIGRAAR